MDVGNVNNLNSSGICILSNIIGWIYFTAWTISFYPQIWENYTRHSVTGLCIDYPVYNFTGYLSYSVFTVWGYFDKNIGTGPIELQDLLFAVHGFIMTNVILGQVFYYYDREEKYHKVSFLTVCISFCVWWGFIILLIMERLNIYDYKDVKDKAFPFNSIIYLGFCKAIITLIKYIPQVILNYKRKSTEGWNILNIWLDFFGGLLSLFQNLFDTLYDCASSSSSGDENKALNFVKYCLSFITLFFNIIFFIQHYYLYRRTNKIQLEELSENLIPYKE